VQFTFTGTRDEAWFYLISIAMEVAGEPAIHSIQKIISLISMSDTQDISPISEADHHPYPPLSLHDDMTVELQNISRVITELRVIFNRMAEENRPDVFYYKLRPFMTGWENNPYHTQGVYYEGVVDADNPPEPRADISDTTGSYQKYAGMFNLNAYKRWECWTVSIDSCSRYRSRYHAL
jgi:indoleamine 2,3-dioxygenase